MKALPVLNPNLYYFCQLGKAPNMGKLINCCFGKGCKHLGTRKCKTPYRKGSKRRNHQQE